MNIGDNIRMCLWDKTVPNYKRFGSGIITNIKIGEICESGKMVTVENRHGDILYVDENWVTSTEPDHDGDVFEL
jgi:hypothetical protein